MDVFEKNKIGERLRRKPIQLQDSDVVIPDDLQLSVVVFQGLILMGVLKPIGVLHKPRIVTMLAQGKQINLAGLPGLPTEINLVGESFGWYNLPQWNDVIYRLYCKITDPRIDPNDERYGQESL